MNWSTELLQAGLAVSIESCLLARTSGRTGRPLGNNTLRVRIVDMDTCAVVAESLHALHLFNDLPLNSLIATCAHSASDHPVLKNLLLKHNHEHGAGHVRFQDDAVVEQAYRLVYAAIERRADNPYAAVLHGALEQLRDSDREILSAATREALISVNTEDSVTRKGVAYAIERAWQTAVLRMGEALRARQSLEPTKKQQDAARAIHQLQLAIELLPRHIWIWDVTGDLVVELRNDVQQSGAAPSA